jgi:hypothetical protein
MRRTRGAMLVHSRAICGALWRRSISPERWIQWKSLPPPQRHHVVPYRIGCRTRWGRVCQRGRVAGRRPFSGVRARLLAQEKALTPRIKSGPLKEWKLQGVRPSAPPGHPSGNRQKMIPSPNPSGDAFLDFSDAAGARAQASSDVDATGVSPLARSRPISRRGQATSARPAGADKGSPSTFLRWVWSTCRASGNHR